MALSIYEKNGSPNIQLEGTRLKLTRTYVVMGTRGEQTVTSFVAANVPITATFSGKNLIRRRIGIEQVGDQSATRATWEAQVEYEEPTNATLIGFEGGVSPNNVHITASKEVVATYAAPGATAPNLKGVIGYRDGDIEGCDIIVPEVEFSLTIEPINVTDPFAFLRSTALLTGRVNANSYCGFSSGELLFRGGNLSGDAEKGFRVAYSFAASPNLSNIKVGDITVTFKRGWDYLDPYYESKVDENSKTLIKQPTAIFIHRVYEYSTFAFPGIDF